MFGKEMNGDYFSLTVSVKIKYPSTRCLYDVEMIIDKFL